jgi:hypothetical protein
MANVMFAQPDRGTAVIEIVGSAREFRSHYLGGFTAALSYYHVPRLCLAPTAHNHNLAVVNHAWGKVLPRGTGAGGLTHGKGGGKALAFKTTPLCRAILSERKRQELVGSHTAREVGRPCLQNHPRCDQSIAIHPCDATQCYG